MLMVWASLHHEHQGAPHQDLALMSKGKDKKR